MYQSIVVLLKFVQRNKLIFNEIVLGFKEFFFREEAEMVCIIAGFGGVGKTTLAKKYKNVLDLESTPFKS